MKNGTLVSLYFKLYSAWGEGRGEEIEVGEEHWLAIFCIFFIIFYFEAQCVRLQDQYAVRCESKILLNSERPQRSK